MTIKIYLSFLLAFLVLVVPIQAQTITDPRDNKAYETVTIGGITWFAANLNFEMRGAYCYDNKQINCDNFGRLYKWEAALSACPPGWHLSTEYEWRHLEAALGMKVRELAYRGNRGVDEGGKMKKGGMSGLEVLYGGWRRKDGGYRALEKNSAFWTSTESDMDHAWHRDIDTGDEFVFRSRVVKSYALSCRCVKNYLMKDGPEN